PAPSPGSSPSPRLESRSGLPPRRSRALRRTPSGRSPRLSSPVSAAAPLPQPESRRLSPALKRRTELQGGLFETIADVYVGPGRQRGCKRAACRGPDGFHALSGVDGDAGDTGPVAPVAP